MNISPPIPTTAQESAPEMARRLGVIVAGLAALVAWRFLRLPHLVALIVPLWTRLTRAARRFERLVLRPARPRKPRTGSVENSQSGATDDARPRSAALPSGRGWLVRELGYEAVAFSLQLEALLAEPAMQAMLAGLPGAGRILRPLCRMLGVPASAMPPAPAIRLERTELVVTQTVRAGVAWPGTVSGDGPGVVGGCLAMATGGKA